MQPEDKFAVGFFASLGVCTVLVLWPLTKASDLLLCSILFALSGWFVLKSRIFSKRWSRRIEIAAISAIVLFILFPSWPVLTGDPGSLSDWFASRQELPSWSMLVGR